MNYKIPLYKPNLSQKEILRVNECLRSSWISSKGKYINSFERLFSKYTKIKYSTVVVNGTAALHLALLALDIKSGDEVIVPTFTYVASVNAIKYVNAKPIFIDSDLNDWQISINEIEKKITKKTKAIICPHIYGQMTNMTKLIKIKKKHKLFLIEDCAEALGSFFKSKHAGKYSDISTFSFYGSKTITTGEGGMLCSDNKSLISKAIKIKLQGISNKKLSYWHDVIGYNYKMTNICAAIGLSQLETIKKILQDKRKIFLYYKKHLESCPLKFQVENHNSINSFWLVGCLTANKKTRDQLMKYLKMRKIETRPGFYPINTMPMYKNYNNQKFKISKQLSDKIICFPSYPKLTKKDLNFICDTIKKFFKK